MRSEPNLRAYTADALRWGSVDGKMIFYGSVDATPLFLRLAVSYVDHHGDGILHEGVTGRDGKQRIFADHLLMAKEWLLQNILRSDIGLVEFQHKNPLGEQVQTWKDSIDGYVHINGGYINSSQPIAPLEVQGYAYDALKGIERLFPGSVPPGTIESLSQRTIAQFWLEGPGLFAQALDRDESGQPRPVETPTSSSGLLLDSELLPDSPGTEEMVAQTVRMLEGRDFMTRAGIRCRSIEFAHLVPYPDYHGSYAVWFKETKDFIRGLERHGYREKALKLARGLISIIQELGEYYEFVFVDHEGVVIPPQEPTGFFTDARSRVPEPGQAWTISAFVYCLRLIQK
jgi:glycogen debranching enzyme